MWGLSFVCTKVLLENGLSAVEAYIYRFALAYLLVLAVSHKQILAHNKRDEFYFLICGICAGSVYFISENTALEYTLATNVSLLTSLSPLITALLSGIMFKNERPSRGMLIGSGVAFIGVFCVIFNSSSSLQVHPLGDALSIAAAFSWAVYSLILRRVSAHYDVWFITRKTFFYGVVTALPFLLFSPTLANPTILFTNKAILVNLCFLVLGPSLVSYVIWSNSVKILGAVTANNYMYFQSVVTMVASYFILGDAITVVGVLGCALIIGGLWMGDWLTQRQNLRLPR